MRRIAVLVFALAAGVIGTSPVARAATTATSSGTVTSPLNVSQIPAIYAQQTISPNLFMLLDDSGSMQFEYLGSLSPDNEKFAYGTPMGTWQPYGGQTYCYSYSTGTYIGCTVPGFGAANIYAAQYRSYHVNPNYYSPSVTYTPWACSGTYPETSNATQTSPSSPINGFSCHWDSGIGLWVMDNASPTDAYFDPGKSNQGGRDLAVWNDSSTLKTATFAGGSSTTWYLGNNSSGNPLITTGTVPFWPATYFNYTGPRPGTTSDFENIANYQRVQICPIPAPLKPDGTPACSPPPLLPSNPKPYHTYIEPDGDYVYVGASSTQVADRSYAQEMQNFANWFQYYRSHILMANAGIGMAFMQLPTGFRVDFGLISKASQDNFTGKTGIESKTDFDSTARSGFLQKLYNESIPVQGTPSRLALYYVGQWFASTPNGDPPWGTSDLTCRPNYTVFMTDGMWNGSSPDVGDQDDTAGNTITNSNGNSYQYQPAPPYQDNPADPLSNTLADVAMKYWKNDIQTGMVNDVPVNSQDGAFWQHMVTFTVGLGVVPTLVEKYMQNHPTVSEQAAQQTVFQQIQNGTTQWPDPFSSNAAKIDDLWHAAVDGHGTFASARNPTQLYKSLADALINIVNRTASSSSLAVSTEKAGESRTSLQVYQAIYHPQNWWGDVLDLPLTFTSAPNSQTVSATVSSDATWSASCILTGGPCPQMGTTSSGAATNTVTRIAPSARNILTWSNTSNTSVPFETTTLSPAEISTIGGSSVIAYIRGVRTQEQDNGGTLRTRDSVMGDVVRSSPVFVPPPDANYPDVWTNLLYPTTQTEPENSASQTYSDFESAESSRQSVVYVGANDGMLHAFDAPPSGTGAGAGDELLGYVPHSVWANLQQYTNPNYTHHYYVNATPGVGDLFNGSQWRTWLVSGEGAGGRSVFAVDITNPASFSSSNPVIHEWGPSNITCTYVANCGNDLGLTFGTPVVTKFNNGKWGFVFGNGFNSPSGTASIFICIIDSPGHCTFYELKTGYGPNQDPTGQGRPDGIAFVTPVDLNGDHITDYVYAGDYFGNIWRFNLTASSPSGWGVSRYGGGGGTPLFSSFNANGTAQPIMTKVQVVAVPSASGYPRVLVDFGTGSAVTASQQLADTSPSGVQSLYGVWDWGFSAWNAGKAPLSGETTFTPVAYRYASLSTGLGSPLTRANLTQQSITNEVSTTTVQGGTNYNRVVTNNIVCWDATTTCSSSTNDSFGWYLDLVSPTAGRQGEKVIYNPIIRDGVFIVNTTIPSTDTTATSCSSVSNTGWTMALDPATGGQLPFQAFDTQDNGKFDELSLTSSQTAVSSGIQLGAVGTPSFVSYGAQTFMVINTASGKATASPLNLNSGSLAVQLTWQELR